MKEDSCAKNKLVQDIANEIFNGDWEEEKKINELQNKYDLNAEKNHAEFLQKAKLTEEEYNYVLEHISNSNSINFKDPLVIKFCAGVGVNIPQ